MHAAVPVSLALDWLDPHRILIYKSNFFSGRQVLDTSIVLGSSLSRCLCSKTVLFHERSDYSQVTAVLLHMASVLVLHRAD